MASILIVEDEHVLGQTLNGSLSDDGYDVHWVPSAEDATVWLGQHRADLLLLDVQLPGIDGLEFLRTAKQAQVDLAAIVMTAHGDVNCAVEAMKLGALDFLLKPIDLDALSLIVKKTLGHRRIERQWEHEQRTRSERFGLDKIIGSCDAVRKAKSMVERFNRLDLSSSTPPPNVLITGATGTGKDLLARAFHIAGPRRDKPFVHVNCAALPEGLVESELFGHAKGAFTGANAAKGGLFEVADQGVLFLDEVSAMPMSSQAKLLTAIETNKIRPVGRIEETAIDVQLIAAMNEDPQALVTDGRLREDLYHRLRVIHVDLPPLRLRGSDMMTLAEHFVRVHCRKFGLAIKSFSPMARKAVREYTWPGNVRELCHRLESAVLLSDGDTIDVELLPSNVPQNLDGKTPDSSKFIHTDFSRGPISLEDVERTLLLRALAAANYNVSRAAALLDISRDTLRYRADKHGLDTSQRGPVPATDPSA